LCAVLAHAQSDELAIQSRKAKELMSARRFEEAISIYKQLVQAVPQEPGLRLNLGLAKHLAGRDLEAIPDFEAVLKAQPNLFPALFSLGATRMALGQPQLAVAPLEKAAAIEPSNRDVGGMLAQAQLQAGRFDRAAVQFRKLAALSDQDPRIWYGLGMSYQAIAGRAFEALQKANPQSGYVAALVAETRVQGRQYRSAFFLYHEALNQIPGLRGAHTALAGIYRETGHLDWAAAEDAKERALPPDDCGAHPAACQFRAGKHLQILSPTRGVSSPELLYWQAKAADELALEALAHLGQLPPSVELHRLKAEIARGQNQHQQSIAEWRAALAIAPGDAALREELALSLFMAQNYSAALVEAQALLKAKPRSPQLNFIAGDSFLRQEAPEKAVPFLRAALAADPKMLEANASLGLALARLGENAEAIPLLEKALPLDQDGSLYYQLARAYRASGAVEKSTKAMAAYQEILKRSQDQKEESARETQIEAPQ
jgi:tetratricopeptide (TPR) repeat protein